ncbi:hypothetical protein BGZ79_000901 [Entomortierella chlamydospora]|nr:hypothetical protein BGZ79_000901 [Entomortierella chlamydospora]
MTKRGKQGGSRGGRGGGRGGHSKPNSGRGGGGGRRGYGGGQYDVDIDFYEDNDDYLSVTGRNHQHRQRSTEEEIYRRIQQAKANRRGGGSEDGSSAPRANGSSGFRPPIPRQNGNGKNSKHYFWPHPDYNNTRNNNGHSSANNSQRGRPRNAPVQVMFQRASSISDPAAQNLHDEDDDGQDPHNLDDDDDDVIDDDESENDSSDDLINRGVDSDDESDEEFLMQQFNWIEEDQDQPREVTQIEQEQPPQIKKEQKKQKAPAAVADAIDISSGSLPISALDTAMTQSEDFLQAMEAEGEIQVHADEIENLSKRPQAICMTTSSSVIHESDELILAKESSETVQLSESGAVLESQTDITVEISVTNDNSSQGQMTSEQIINPVTEEKQKKKAHRSKRGGKNQREKQMSKQMIVGHDDDGPMYLEELSDEEDEEALAREDYLQNTKDYESLNRLESLLAALKGLHTEGYGQSKNVGGIAPDDSDYEQQVSEANSEGDDFDEDDFDFEEDYEDGIKKLDFRKVSASMNDKRKNRKADDLLRDELQDLMPLWQAGVLQDGDGANRRFKSRAKGYDIYDSDDGFMVASSAGGRKKNKNKKEPHGGSFETLMSINKQIEDFVKDRTSDNLQLPPMPKALRRKVHLLCNHYNLKSQSVGSGKSRFPILIKTDRTKMPLNPVNVNKLLNQSEKELTKLSAQFQGSRKGGNGGNGGNNGGGKGKGKGRGMGSGNSMAAMHGTVVGASASAISVDNVGHRMLSKMGWSPGVGLGATGDGITQPIEAIMRAKRRGLGHE